MLHIPNAIHRHRHGHIRFVQTGIFFTEWQVSIHLGCLDLKNFIFRQITGHKIENHAICNIYFLHIKWDIAFCHVFFTVTKSSSDRIFRNIENRGQRRPRVARIIRSQKRVEAGFRGGDWDGACLSGGRIRHGPGLPAAKRRFGGASAFDSGDAAVPPGLTENSSLLHNKKGPLQK